MPSLEVRSCALGIALIIAGLAAAVPAAGSVPAPRALSEAERQGVALAMIYLRQGAAGWWPRLAAGAPLRALGREAALAEIGARAGPASGATWQLQTPGPRYRDGTVIFTVEFPSGVGETLFLDLAEEAGWKIVTVRALADPSLLPPAALASDDPPTPELGALLPLRTALAGVGGGDHRQLFRSLPKGGAVGRVALLWEAQHFLRQSQLDRVQKLLDGLPSPADDPLSGLLRARLAFARSQPEPAVERYGRLLTGSADYDALRQEAAEAALLMGLPLEAEAFLRRARESGSRRAEIYYFLALMAAQEERMDAAEGFFLTAWRLEPVPRKSLFSEPLLASLSARPEFYESFKLGSAAEPVVKPTVGRRPLEYSPEAKLVLLGNQLTITLGAAEIVVPGGAELAPVSTPIEDAATRAEREGAQALSQLDVLKSRARTAGALVEPRLRRDTLTAAAALAQRRRWRDLLQLTESISQSLDQIPPTLAKLRARALIESERMDEARDLLVEIAHGDVAKRRRDPGTFIQLAELLASIGEYDRAIKAHQKAASLSPTGRSDRRIRQLTLEKDLATSYLEYRSDHFHIRYPVSTHARYPELLAGVLEAERKRLSAWIPVRSDRQVEVHLFPLNEFMRSFSAGVAVLGLYDGRVRVPFADLESLDPVIISILSHELAHAMIAEVTNDHAPKWLHEGLAQHVQMVQDFVNPIPDLHRTSRILALPVIEMVLAGFGDPQLVELAYSEASWVMHFIEARWGREGIHGLLDAVAGGRSTEQAIRKAFGMSVAAFERQAWDWCLKEAPADWPAELYRYDRDFTPYYDRREPRPKSRAVATAPAANKISMREAMATWHQAYAPRVLPVKISLGKVIAVYRRSAPGDVGVLCATLHEDLSAVIGDRQVLAAPDKWVTRALRLAYEGFHRAAAACRQGRDASVRAELDKAEFELTVAAKQLAKYGLRP